MTTERTMHEAFLDAYADIENPKKNATNPAFKSKYANLEEMLNVTRPLLAAVGFALIQEPVSDGESIGVRTRLIHKSGEGLDFGTYTVPLAKHDAQGAGSAITYTRRYAIASIFGLAQEDDDGNGAVDSKPPVARDAQQPAQPVESKQDEPIAPKYERPAASFNDGEDFTMTIGKFKGQTLREIAKHDLSYIAWVADKYGFKDGVENPKYAAANEKVRKLAADIHGQEILHPSDPAISEPIDELDLGDLPF